ncbi:peptidoglycan recognition family protein [Robiginitalea aestuariiviva]|uniref:N-acetylmuramoyl-L-alanine amidase n=1 Tax=Robiginitalea aestuariiviva TaxID=3036903 RepID=UPI0030C77AF8
MERPITWDAERERLSLAYLEARYGLTPVTPRINPKMVVLHWTAIPTLEKSLEAFEPSRLPQTRPDIQTAGALNVSAHYLVDRDGTIYHLLADTLMARHTIGLNHCAIGIENVGGTPETPLTEAQLKANIWLVRHLKASFPITYLIGHHEYTSFEGHPLWLEQDSAYRTEKTDPGPAFMNDVRRAVKDLGLQGPPKMQNP